MVVGLSPVSIVTLDITGYCRGLAPGQEGRQGVLQHSPHLSLSPKRRHLQLASVGQESQPTKPRL